MSSIQAAFDVVEWLSAHGARQHRLDHEDEAKKFYACADEIERLREHNARIPVLEKRSDSFQESAANLAAELAGKDAENERLRSLLSRCELELPPGELRDELWRECGTND